MKHPLRLTGALATLALAFAWLVPAVHTVRADVATHEDLLGKLAPDFEADFAVNVKPAPPADKPLESKKGKQKGKPKKEITVEVKDKKVLEQLKNRVVVLVFWGIWSGPSRDVLTPLQQWYKNFHSKGLEVVGVTVYSSDSKHKIGFDKITGRFTKKVDNPTQATDRQMLKDFAAARKIMFPLMKLSRAEVKRVYKLYGVHGIPQLVVIDAGGRVRMIRVGSTDENLEDIETEFKKRFLEIK